MLFSVVYLSSQLWDAQTDIKRCYKPGVMLIGQGAKASTTLD